MIRRTHAVPALIVVLAILSIYLLRLNAAAGLMVDDAYYVMLAKVLSEGGGYRLVSSATTAMVPLYPPGFPAILSIVFHLFPEFPQNVWLLKCVSIAAMLGVGLLTYAYARRRQMPQELAACVAIAVTITPAFVFLATSTVMSECVFTLFQLATVLLIHRSVDTGDARRARIFTIGAALTAGAIVLIRSAGLGLVAGGRSLVAEGAALETRGAVWRSRRGLCPSLDALCTRSCTNAGGTCAAWWLHRVFVRRADLDALGGRSGIRDGDASRFPRASWSEHRRRIRAWNGRPVRADAVPRSRRERRGDGGSRWCRRSGSREAWAPRSATMAISLVLSAVVMLGFVQTARRHVTVAELLVPISLGIIFLWPFWTFRFVVPLAPYLFFYLVAGIRTVAPLERRAYRLHLHDWSQPFRSREICAGSARP